MDRIYTMAERERLGTLTWDAIEAWREAERDPYDVKLQTQMAYEGLIYEYFPHLCKFLATKGPLALPEYKALRACLADMDLTPEDIG